MSSKSQKYLVKNVNFLFNIWILINVISLEILKTENTYKV